MLIETHRDDTREKKIDYIALLKKRLLLGNMHDGFVRFTNPHKWKYFQRLRTTPLLNCLTIVKVRMPRKMQLLHE